MQPPDIARPELPAAMDRASPVVPKELTAEVYKHADHELNFHHRYLLPAVERVLGEPNRRTLFEIGFGNGAVANYLSEKGFIVSGIEPSSQGVQQARAHYPRLRGLHQGSVYDDLTAAYGAFDIVLSLEVIEHLYAPRRFAEIAFALLKPGGLLVLSTPYHGYAKNLVISLLGRWDSHASPLWDHGHIKLWSRPTISTLLTEAGFSVPVIDRLGRVPVLAKSMLAAAKRLR